MAATIPISLSRMTGRPEARVRGSVLLFGFGAGLAYAGQVVEVET
jgi:3-oxoacyl-[acyl-carrier-protein] synthase-3